MIIRALRSDRETFRTVRFKDGANVVLADRTPDSGKKDSRNGLGKSAMLEIISFCLGGSMGETLKRREVKGWTFTLDVEHGGRSFSISRRTGDNAVEISGDTAGWPVALAGNATIAQDGVRIKVDDFNRGMGRMLYGLESHGALGYRPTFRSLISYRVRQGGKHGGYRSPFQSFHMQTAACVQVNNAYMLGLNWETGAHLQDLTDHKRKLRDLERDMSDGVLSDLVGSIGDIEAILIRLEDRARREKDAIDRFRVHDQYKDLESEANGLTESIHGLVNERFSMRKASDMYRESLEEENDATPEQVLGVYRDAGVLLPDTIRKGMEEVRAFHTAIVRNRRGFLGSEIDRLGGEVSKRSLQIDKLGARRATIMGILQTHGAIDELVRLQERHNATVSEQADAANKLAQLKRLGEEKASIDARMNELRRDATIDFDERRDRRKAAILTFNDYSKRLYRAPGKLVIDIKDGLYRFNVEIERSGSSGIGSMKIFCYDMMLAGLWAGRSESPGFLAHDSDLFEGVDSRQTAKALGLAATESADRQFQYICTMNTDDVPHDDFDKGFDFDSLVAATLTDREAGGSLLGIRF